MKIYSDVIYNNFEFTKEKETTGFKCLLVIFITVVIVIDILIVIPATS